MSRATARNAVATRRPSTGISRLVNRRGTLTPVLPHGGMLLGVGVFAGRISVDVRGRSSATLAAISVPVSAESPSQKLDDKLKSLRDARNTRHALVVRGGGDCWQEFLSELRTLRATHPDSIKYCSYCSASDERNNAGFDISKDAPANLKVPVKPNILVSAIFVERMPRTSLNY